MKQLFALLALCYLTLLNAQQFNPPPNPPAPSFKDGLLPVVLVNNSQLTDDDVYVVITGKNPNTNPEQQVFVQFDNTGVGTLVTANSTLNATNFTKTLSQFPVTSGGHVLYLPNIDSALIFFSINTPLNMPVNAPNSIVQPNFTSPSDPNYNTIFDIFELAFVSATNPNIVADATAVSFFSIPLYGFISTPNTGSLANTGLYQPRNYILSQIETFFNSAKELEATQWKNLVLMNGSTTLRVLSTGKGMSTAPSPLFDPNYLDNATTYGYSYLQNIWSGPSSFYKTHPLILTIPNGSLETYQGTVNAANLFTFTSTSGYNVVFSSPTPPGTAATDTTSYTIFSGLPLYTTDTSPGGQDGVQVSKLFEEAIIAGLLPTTNEVSNTYLAANQNNFYTINPSLSPVGQATGPWYDLYSKALHSLGYIYTFAFDEPLWPQVQIASNTLLANQTYLGITIGSFANTPASTTTLTSSLNPSMVGQTVTFTTSVTGSTQIPTGTVTLTIDGVSQSPISLTNGQANFQTSTLSVGQHTIVASYSGDVTYLPSTSAPLTQTITSQNPVSTTVLASSLDPAMVGQAVSFIANVTGSNQTPTGIVTFNIDGTLTNPIPLVNGQASFQTSALSVGQHTIIASYSGDEIYQASTSASLTQTITPQTSASTTTTLTSSLNPAIVGQTVTFMANVTGGNQTPTGTVTLNIDGTLGNPISLVNGQASFQISNLSLGKHTIIASYSGDNSYLSSTSNPLIQVIIFGVESPRDLKVKQVKNEFATQIDLINMITWKAPRDSKFIIQYKIYRDRQLTDYVANISSKEKSSNNTFKYEDHHRKKGHTYRYFIVSVDKFNNTSLPAEVTFCSH